MKARNMVGALALITVVALLSGACQTQAAPAQSQPTTAQSQPTTAPAQPQPTPKPQTTLQRIKREGFVRVGFANEKPFAYATAEGKLAGEAPDIARVIFKNLGIAEMEGVLTEFGSLIPGLQANRFDVITAGMYIKAERCQQVLFAEPEYKIGSGLLVKAGNPFNLHSLEDIAKDPKVRVGTGAGYLENDYLLGVGVPKERITLFPDDPSGLAGVKAGQIDAYVATSMAILTILNNAKDASLAMADPFTDPVIKGKAVVGYAGTAFRKGDEDLRDAFNVELKKLKDSGQLLEILTKNGFGPQNLPGNGTTEEACKP